VIEVLEDCEFACQFDRVKFAPPGWGGGREGAKARVAVIHDGQERELPGKVLAARLVCGDRVVIETQGGGGFGDPLERDPDALRRDLEEGKVTSEAVRQIYAGGEAAYVRESVGRAPVRA
jgi:N-methylhydantoinase B